MWPLQTSSLEEKNLLYECKVLQNRIVKWIEILIFKGFDKVSNCMKYLIGEWCGIIVTHRKLKSEKMFLQTKT